MPAKSKSQQRLMGMVYKYKETGELPDNASLADKVKKIAAGISKEDAKAFAKTKHKGKPEVVESFTFKQFLLSETKYDDTKKCPKCNGEIEQGYRASTPVKRCKKCGWEIKGRPSE